MPDVKALQRTAQAAPLRIPLVFPALSGTYRYAVNAAHNTGSAVNGDGQFLLGSVTRDQGLVVSGQWAESWKDFVPGQTSIGTPSGLLRNQNPPTTQVAVLLTQTDSDGRTADYTSGTYRITRLDATTFQPAAPVPASLDMAIISVDAATGIYLDATANVEGAQMLYMYEYSNLQGPAATDANFALQVTPIMLNDGRFRGTLYASRQDQETLDSLIAASGQLAYSAERLYLTRYEASLRSAQSFVAEGRRWSVNEIRRVGRRYMLLAADALF